MTRQSPHCADNAQAWLLDAQWPVFAGHFPAHPVLPGALLLDWVIDNIRQRLECETSVVTQVKFPSAAVPGDRLTLELRQEGARVRFEVQAQGDQSARVVASGVASIAGAAQ